MANLAQTSSNITDIEPREHGKRESKLNAIDEDAAVGYREYVAGLDLVYSAKEVRSRSRMAVARSPNH